jgi:hypothetical protein
MPLGRVLVIVAAIISGGPVISDTQAAGLVIAVSDTLLEVPLP